MTAEDQATEPPASPRLSWREQGKRYTAPFGLDHFHRVVALLLATATLVLAIATYLEVEAHSNAETASTEAQLLQIQAASTEITGRSQTKFDYDSAYLNWLQLDLRAFRPSSPSPRIDASSCAACSSQVRPTCRSPKSSASR